MSMSMVDGNGFINPSSPTLFFVHNHPLENLLILLFHILQIDLATFNLIFHWK